MGNNGRFSDGFLMGALVGGAAVFLLGTEKGNKVLKVILEEGRASFNDLMDEIEEYKEEMSEAAEILVDDEIEGENIDQVVEEAPKVVSENHAPSTTKTPSSKRFFRKK